MCSSHRLKGCAFIISLRILTFFLPIHPTHTKDGGVLHTHARIHARVSTSAWSERKCARECARKCMYEWTNATASDGAGSVVFRYALYASLDGIVTNLFCTQTIQSNQSHLPRFLITQEFGAQVNLLHTNSDQLLRIATNFLLIWLSGKALLDASNLSPSQSIAFTCGSAACPLLRNVFVANNNPRGLP